jgi:hypothetical protein
MIIGFAITVLLIFWHIWMFRKNYKKFSLHILSFYDDKGIPYRIGPKVFEDSEMKNVENKTQHNSVKIIAVKVLVRALVVRFKILQV